MRSDDPRLKHGIRVRVTLLHSTENRTVEGYVIDPLVKAPEGFFIITNLKFPGNFMWCYVAYGATTREEFPMLSRVRLQSETVHNDLMEKPTTRHWLGIARLVDMEYLDAGFSEDMKPKNRRGKRHRMRVKDV